MTRVDRGTARVRRARQLARVAGIQLAAEGGVLLIVAILLAGLVAVRLPSAHPDRDPAAYWSAAVLTTLLFAASVLVHELAHARAMRTHGVGSRGHPHSPQTELAVAAAGPTASALLGGAFGTAAGILALAGADGLTTSLAAYLGTANFALAVVNLLPAASLDGGRILRAWIWRATGDPLRAAVTTTRAGRVLSFALILLGVGLLLLTGAVAGLGLTLAGWFLANQASLPFS